MRRFALFFAPLLRADFLAGRFAAEVEARRFPRALLFLALLFFALPVFFAPPVFFALERLAAFRPPALLPPVERRDLALFFAPPEALRAVRFALPFVAPARLGALPREDLPEDRRPPLFDALAGWLAALPATAPMTPPTTAPTGPATLPMTAPVAAPAACLEMGGIEMVSEDSVLEED